MTCGNWQAEEGSVRVTMQTVLHGDSSRKWAVSGEIAESSALPGSRDQDPTDRRALGQCRELQCPLDTPSLTPRTQGPGLEVGKVRVTRSRPASCQPQNRTATTGLSGLGLLVRKTALPPAGHLLPERFSQGPEVASGWFLQQ